MGVLEGIFQRSQTAQGGSAATLAYALLIAFIVGQFNAWCYRWTHRGVSYSRTFTQALVLISIIVAFSMSLVSTNVIAAFGLLGGLAIIRFRTVVRDARDNTYVLLCLVCGMAAGFGYYGAAAIGALGANLISLYLHFSGFGAWYSTDSLLRFQVRTASFDYSALDHVLRRFCRRYWTLSVDETPALGADERLLQCSYRVRLANTEGGPDLIAALQAAFAIDAIHLLVQQENEEVA